MGKAGPTFLVLISLLIFFVEVAFSKWWLGTHQFGPLEWVWRKAAYHKVQSKS